MAWGMVAGAAIGVVGGAIASNQSSKAAQGAANTQARAAEDANRVQLQMYNQSRADNEPFRQNAMTAQNEFMTLMGLGSPQPQQAQGQTNVSGAFANNPFDSAASPLGGASQGQFRALNPKLMGRGEVSGFNPSGGTFFNGSTYQPMQAPGAATTQAPAQTPQQMQQSAFDRFRNTPGYQFGLDTGRKQLESSAAARGGLYSGAAMKALQRYGNDYADQQGYTPYMNRLASLAGMGQTANAQNATLGMNYANNAGANLINAGNARASSLQQQGNNNAQLTAGIAGGISGLAQGYFAQRTPSYGMAPGYGSAQGNYNWASSSGFGNNWGNF